MTDLNTIHEHVTRLEIRAGKLYSMIATLQLKGADTVELMRGYDRIVDAIAELEAEADTIIAARNSR